MSNFHQINTNLAGSFLILAFFMYLILSKTWILILN